MKWLSAIIMILTLGACSTGSQENSEPVVDANLIEVAPSQEQAEEKPDAQGSGGVLMARKFVKNGRVEFETEDAAATRKVIMASVSANNAYVSRDDEDRTEGAITYTITVHVPAARFEQFLTSATAGISDFKQKAISNEDVTAQYVDAESRLKTKKEIENRYRALLGKASSVKDILEIEKELGEIRTDIESTEAQFKQLNNDITYSTLHIVFFKTLQPTNSFVKEIADAFGEGVRNLRGFVVVLVAIWPFVLLAIGLIFGFNWLKKRRIAKQKQEAAELSSE